MDRDSAREEVRRRVSCERFLKPSKAGLWCCPECGSGNGKHATGAVKLYPGKNRWYCHKCRKGGDVIDLYQRSTGKDFSSSLQDLASEIGIEIDQYRTKDAQSREKRAVSGFSGVGSIQVPQKEKSRQNAEKEATEATPDYRDYYLECLGRLSDPAAQAYLQRRGISLEVARRYGIGFDPKADPANAPGGVGTAKHPCPRLIIPTGPTHYVGRRIDGIRDYEKMNPKGSRASVFNESALYSDEIQELFVTEGAFDALSFAEACASAVAINSAANANDFIKMLEQRKTSATMILALDNDESGRQATEIIATGLKKLGIPYIIPADLCAGTKDPNESLMANRAGFVEAVERARQDARRQAAALREQARLDAQERQRRTGAAMVDSFLQEIRSEKYAPIPTGFSDIDKALGGGFIRQQLVLLGAAPGAGKTALAQQIFEGLAQRGISVCYLNLEMSREQLLARSISRLAARNGHKVYPTRILRGYEWTLEDEDAVLSAASEYRGNIAPFMIYNPDDVGGDLDAILSYLEREADIAEAAGLPVPLVVLDYLQILTGKRGEDDATLLKRAVRSLKDFAVRRNTLVFTIIAHNRESNRSGGVSLESGRDTSALEYSADTQLGLAFTRCLKRDGFEVKSRDELTLEEKKFVTLKVTKSRFSSPGAGVDLFFDGETMSFAQTVGTDLEFAAGTGQKKAGRKLEKSKG